MLEGPPPGAAPTPRDLTGGERAALGALLAAAALGHTAAVPALVAEVRRAGVPPEALREALLMLVPYAGYPRALATFAAAKLASFAGGEAEPAAPAREARGRDAFEAVYGLTASRVLAGLQALDPCLPAWTLEHAYGRVLSRPGLALRERELLAVTLLTALGGLEDPLLGHMRGAVRLGASSTDVLAAVEAVPAALGEPQRVAARRVLARLASGGA